MCPLNVNWWRGKGDALTHRAKVHPQDINRNNPTILCESCQTKNVNLYQSTMIYTHGK